MTDYSELKGTELESSRYGTCFVVNISIHEGITIKDLDKQIDRVCLNKKLWHKCNYGHVPYEEMFDIFLHQIYCGVLFAPKERNEYMDFAPTPASSSPICAFGGAS